MWIKKLGHKKVQFFLMGVVFFVIATIFAMCLCFTMEIGTFSQNSLTKTNCPDVFVISKGDTNLQENITDKTVRDNLKQVVPLTGKTVSVPIKYNDSNIALYHQLALAPEDYTTWQYIQLENTRSVRPNPGEVWIAKKMAQTIGIKVGDTITLEYPEPIVLMVSNIYKATFAPATANAFAPIIISPQDVEKLGQELDAALIGINFYEDGGESIKALSETYPYFAASFSRDDLRAQITGLSTVIGGFGFIAALIVFIIALALIRFIIKNDLLKEYRDIGIYKSLGYTSQQIIDFYLNGYLLIGFIAITLGSLASLPITYKIGRMFTACIDGFTITKTSYLLCMVVIVVLMGILYFNTHRALKKIKDITPVEAISVGNNHAEGKMTPSVIKNASTPMEMAINDVFKYKKATAMILLILTTSISLCMLFTKITYSFVAGNETMNLWFAIPKYNAYISGDISDELVQDVKNNSNVESIIYGDLSYTIKFDAKAHQEEMYQTRFDIYSDAREEVTNVPISQGVAPIELNQVAITEQLASKINVGIGDYLELTINDKDIAFQVCGMYNSMLSTDGIMLTIETLQQVMPEYRSSAAFVNLKDMNQFEVFKRNTEAKFSGISIDLGWFAVDNSVASIKSMIVSICIILISIFIIFSTINIIILLLMEKSDKHRQVGILKALGFTSSYVVKQTLYKFTLLSVISTVLALILHILFSGKLLAALIIDAFIDSYVLIGLLVIGILALVIIITYLIGMGSRKISPVELMEE